jgi:hypothetical protein
MRIFNKYFWQDLRYNIVYGIRNLRSYFKVVWKARPWDFNFTSMEMLKLNLEILLPRIENGYEVDESRLVKVANIKRCIELIDRLVKDDYVTELGGLTDHPIEFVPVDDNSESGEKLYTMKEFRTQEEIDHDGQILRLSLKLRENDWVELWQTIQDGAEGWWS